MSVIRLSCADKPSMATYIRLDEISAVVPFIYTGHQAFPIGDYELTDNPDDMDKDQIELRLVSERTYTTIILKNGREVHVSDHPNAVRRKMGE